MTRTRPQSWLRGMVMAALALALVLSGCADEGPYTHDLASELMSPFCPGRTLATCPSPQAGELIQWIQVQEAAGVTKEEVVAMLIDRFGEEIQGAPPAEGITLWAYVFPVAAFLGGGGLVAIVLRRIVGRRDDEGDDDEQGDDSEPPAPPPGPSSPEDDELARLVDEELSNRR